ncbi:MAG TPA: 4-hydroxybenzoate octaprenyltransferase [Pirellulales bacterium]|jgi:4-hydroxybenzoate polyprenyltransferase|nr:4-hydroxybenzoate octaprenyltransferase [Pirellulales bacterium]
MFGRLRLMLEMIRFSHTVFALPFALLAAVMAWREGTIAWRWQDLAGVVLCMVLARSTAMAVNRLADRRIDAANPRTRSRHLPAGLLSVAGVATFTALCAAAFVASTLLFLPNRWPLFLSLPVLIFLCGYSFAKRFTALAHFWLGAALGLAPVAAWIALRGELGWPPVVLGAAVMFWVGGFDIIYACQDVEYDTQTGLYSLPARLGVPKALRVAAFCHLIAVLALLGLPLVYRELGWIYLAGIGAVALLLAYEHRLVRPDDLTRVNVAFFHVNAVVSIGLFLVGTADLLLPLR